MNANTQTNKTETNKAIAILRSAPFVRKDNGRLIRLMRRVGVRQYMSITWRTGK